ncbi:Glycosyl transferase family 2 [Cohaesibacter marisflavi]|uniref:Glycosyl transferase family 2 n=1 Tax=Cohaesibacter marisflavi TaxID=655353 RepID=A0A1I5H904_9HYPH|nr:glycosyltransferase [Cohaesibacter marisflavi]SFO44486.1 Glycosyl transferase family 2 [Cohaesibacter marisflavi]
MEKIPEISVVLPVYNGEKYIEAALISILEQDFTDFELLVINDGSVDGTEAILERLAAQDERIRILARDNDGLVSALNWGLEEARAPLIARMDADDISYPNRFSKQWQFLKDNPDVGLVFAQMNKVDAQGKPIGKVTNTRTSPQDVAVALSKGNCLPHHPTVMARRSEMLGAGGYRDVFKGAEDLDLWYRMSKRTKLAGLADVLLDYRLHEGQVTQTSIVRQRFSQDLIILIAKELEAGRDDPSKGWDCVPSFDWTATSPQLLAAPANMVALFRYYHLIDRILTLNGIKDLASEDLDALLDGLKSKSFFGSAKVRQVLAHHIVQEARRRGLRGLALKAMLFALKTNPSRALRHGFKPF